MNTNPIYNQTEVYVSLEYSVLKLDYNHGASLHQVRPDDEKDWNEALLQRGKHCLKAVRDSNTLDAMVSKIKPLLNASKIAKKDGSTGKLIHS